jgi:succinoglycan biosynthesis protein ExoM
MICSICINTYKRPELLKILLDSLITQKKDTSLFIEVIIVENDKIPVSQPVVEEFEILLKDNPNWRFKYYLQPEKNIAITRNKAVSESEGKYIFFIDDDEYAEPDWIEKSITCLENYNADGIFGVVRSYFDPKTPEWIKNNNMFHREVQITGSEPKFTRTGNCLIKTEILKSIDGPFDVKYGITGGSDSHLFNLLLINGAKFITCSESIVHEYIPPERANIKWMIQRMIRTGNSFARRTIELSNFKFIIRLFIAIKAIGMISIYSVLFFFNLFSKSNRNQNYIRLYSYIGHIFAVFNYHYEEYK